MHHRAQLLLTAALLLLIVTPQTLHAHDGDQVHIGQSHYRRPKRKCRGPGLHRVLDSHGRHVRGCGRHRRKHHGGRHGERERGSSRRRSGVGRQRVGHRGPGDGRRAFVAPSQRGCEGRYQCAVGRTYSGRGFSYPLDSVGSNHRLDRLAGQAQPPAYAGACRVVALIFTQPQAGPGYNEPICRNLESACVILHA